MNQQPYNPLDKKNLGVSVAEAMLHREPTSLPLTEEFPGAGIYAIYYVGTFALYQRIAIKNQNGLFGWPIY